MERNGEATTGERAGHTVRSSLSYLSKDQLGCCRRLQARKTVCVVEGTLTSESIGAGKTTPQLPSLTFGMLVTPSAKNTYIIVLVWELSFG